MHPVIIVNRTCPTIWFLIVVEDDLHTCRLGSELVYFKWGRLVLDWSWADRPDGTPFHAVFAIE